MVDAELLPTEEDVLFYEEHGWYVSKKIIPDSVIDAAIAGSEAFYRGERDNILKVDTGFSDWKAGDGDVARNNEFVSLQKKEIRDLALQPIIGAVAARLARSPEIRLLDDQLIYKPPQQPDSRRSTATGWHCDGAYWSTCTSDRLITAWIPLHDCELERGPLVFMDKSHKWRGLSTMRHFNNTALQDVESQLSKDGNVVTKIPMTLKKGQVSFHHKWTVHGSYPNRSQYPRRSLAVHLQDQDNQYRAYRTPEGREVHIADESLCRLRPDGTPDFRDPEVFPVLWRQPD